MKISKRAFGLMMGVATGLVMSLLMSLTMLVMSIGFVEGFVFIWLKSSATSFAVSGPIAIIAIPLIERFLRRVVSVQE